MNTISLVETFVDRENVTSLYDSSAHRRYLDTLKKEELFELYYERELMNYKATCQANFSVSSEESLYSMPRDVYRHLKKLEKPNLIGLLCFGRPKDISVFTWHIQCLLASRAKEKRLIVEEEKKNAKMLEQQREKEKIKQKEKELALQKKEKKIQKKKEKELKSVLQSVVQEWAEEE